MNSQVAKVFRKWAKHRGLPWNAVRKLYQQSSFAERRQMFSEAVDYNAAVKNGTTLPSMPKLPSEAKVRGMVEKTPLYNALGRIQKEKMSNTSLENIDEKTTE